MTRADALRAALVGALAACAAQDALPPPRPTAIAPVVAFASGGTVEIAGAAFHVRAVQRADGGGSTVDAGYRAWLGALELVDVTWVDERTLHARVPAGLAVGRHDLRIQGPHGTGTLPAAYLVVDGVPASLGISLSVPGQIGVGDPLQLTVRAENTGTWVVEQVMPQVTASGDGGLEPFPGTIDPRGLATGAHHDFVLGYTATRLGPIVLTVGIAGTDPRTGGRVSTAATASVLVRPQPSVAIIQDDPFLQDGTAFAFVATYRGKVVLGPNRTGTGLVRMAPDGSGLESLGLSISRDASGNTSSNSAWEGAWPGTYPSIGFTGCIENRVDDRCGPDNEDGRGFMTSAAFGGDEWLVLGGARSGGSLEYVYLSRGATTPLPFSYVDLSLALGGNTRGFSAVAVAGDRLFLGFPDNGGNRPYGISLGTAPPPPGLDAVLGTDVVNYNLNDAYSYRYGGITGVSMVDTIGALDGRVYFFNDTGCVVARDDLAPPVAKEDFSACSPAESAAYAAAQSIVPVRQYDLTPRDRAWPAAVAWKGRLFAIRNTTTGPQLWRCDPAAGTDATGCDRADWTLVAADASTGYRTRFGKAGATAATLLLATADHLWIGLDDDAGVHLFRTSADVPTLASDFTGQGGCVAGTPTCEGFGGDGLGAPPSSALTHILDGKAVEWSGGTDLVLAVGNGTGPVKVVRVAP